MTESDPAVPSPPASIPAEVVNVLHDQDASTLEALASYAQELADAQCDTTAIEETNQTSEDLDNEQFDGDSETHPEEVPGKATVVTKTINGYEYYYWQWRDGEAIKSKYKAPVNPKQ